MLQNKTDTWQNLTEPTVTRFETVKMKTRACGCNNLLQVSPVNVTTSTTLSTVISHNLSTRVINIQDTKCLIRLASSSLDKDWWSPLRYSAELTITKSSWPESVPLRWTEVLTVSEAEEWTLASPAPLLKQEIYWNWGNVRGHFDCGPYLWDHPQKILMLVQTGSFQNHCAFQSSLSIIWITLNSLNLGKGLLCWVRTPAAKQLDYVLWQI